MGANGGLRMRAARRAAQDSRCALVYEACHGRVTGFASTLRNAANPLRSAPPGGPGRVHRTSGPANAGGSLEDAFTGVQTIANPIRRGATATLQYAVRDREPVQVELYNVLGQRVRTLRDGWSTPGAVTTLRIPTADLASGKYFLRITGRSFTRTENVSIVR